MKEKWILYGQVACIFRTNVRAFPQTIQTNHNIKPRVCHYCFLWSPFQFIIHPTIPDKVISLSSNRIVKYPQKSSTLLHMTKGTPKAFCYVWHKIQQQHFVTYGTMYTNRVLLRMTQNTPTALCYIRHNVHQQHLVTYGTMFTNSTLLCMAQRTPTSPCYIWHNVHQQHFVMYGTMYTNSTLLRTTQWTPTAFCSVWHNIH